MNLRYLKYCEDIRKACEEIESFMAMVKDGEDYKANLAIRRAVERSLEICGEATKQLLDEFPTTPFPGAPRIIGLRNRLIHGYAAVDDDRIWSIVVTYLPDLKATVLKLMEEANA